MVDDAAAHEAEDRSRRESAEAKNTLDSMVYQTEKTLGEHKDKLEAADAEALETAIKEAREVLDSGDAEKLKAATEKLTEASHKLAEVMYKQAADGGADPSAAAQEAASDVVDAEVVDD